MLTIDTTDSLEGNIGVIAVVPVSMWQVASVMLTAQPGTRMAKGDEYGYFQFGGSETIILLQDGLEVQVDPDEGHRLMGTVIARCTPRRIPRTPRRT